MKKIFAILMTVAMLLSLGAVLAAAELPGADIGVNWTAGKYGVENAEDFTPAGDFPITWDAAAASKLDLTDGDMDDWQAADYDMITIDASNMVSWVGDPTTAPAGWNISTYFVADAEWLYIGFFVTDPNFTYITAGDYHSGDAFQVCIDFGGRLGKMLKENPEDVGNPKNIFYSFGCVADGEPIEIMRQESDQDEWISEANGDGVKGAAKKTETGWSAEFALSWQQLYDDYTFKAWEDPTIYVGGDKNLPLNIGCCLYYLDEGGTKWAAGSTNGIADDSGVPQVSWTAYDNGLNLSLAYAEGMEFKCTGIKALELTVTVPEETEPAETEAPETEAKTEAATQAPETEAATQAPAADTKAPETTAAATEEGCASVIGFGAVAVLAAAAAFVALKKKD